MYHTNKINQALIKENLSTPRFSYNYLHIDHYPSSCTPTQQKIFNYIRQYQYQPWIKLRNERIADAVGCSVITVIRATNKFHKDGFITKHQENIYTSNNYTLRIIVDHKNKRIFQSEYDRPNKSLILEDSLFKNLSPSSRVREGDSRIFKKINDRRQRWTPQKGMTMYDFQDKPFFTAKLKEKIVPKKRNADGHSPMVVKQTLSLEDQIHAKKVDIAFFRVQIEKPETFWDSHSILFSVNVKMAESLLSKALEELQELEAKKNGNENRKDNSNENQNISYQHNSHTMAEYIS